ncbi:MAG: AMIN domain-containing protein [Phormidium tanganyikae FI6-MK23]|nr:AMIN domain-containing protein [Phormidium tanganyikae FI6-MK23]
MKELRAISLMTAATLALISHQPASANPTQVTNVKVNPNGSGFDVVLETQGGKAPQVFNVNRGNTWNAYVFNAQISQPFRQNNPAPGISQISVIPSGANGVQVTVVGTSATPIGQIASRNAQGVIFNVSGAGGGSSPNAATNVPPVPIAVAQATPSASLPMSPVAQMPNSTTPIAPFVPSAQVPNQGQPTVPVAPTPPLMRRAVAPPVGDQAVSQIDTSATTIDLGTNERIPRLVLRDAPVREVLSLLARAANLNLAYSESGASGAAPAAGQAAKANGPTISLDIQNESVQDVFNYVLRVACLPVASSAGGAGGAGSGACASLDVNRVGRTIFVGPRLPDDARNIISRTIRLNQVSVADASGFLTTQGAETQRPFEQIEVQTIGEGAAARTIETRTPTILSLRATEGTAPLILRGLSVSSNDRLNSITLTGAPRKVEIATRLLGQLDARRRQVSINVKIVDVNLLKTEDFNTSFSFGIGNNFFNVDRGAAVFNFGQYRPPTAGETGGNLAGRPIIDNPYQGGNIFLNPSGSVNFPGTASGTRTILNDGVNNIFRRTETPPPNSIGTGSFPSATPGVSSNPLQPGITDYTLATPSVETTTITAGTPGTPATPDRLIPTGNGNFTFVPGTPATPGTRDTVTSNFVQGTAGTITRNLPSFFQFPTQFLARLQSQVTSGNAKILASPTVVVQDGEKSSVRLTQEVFSGFRRNTQVNGTQSTDVSEPIIREAGLTLNLIVDRIDDNGFVTLRVNPVISAPSNAVNTPQGPITLISGRSVESGAIRVRDGQTLILSGIIQETDRASVTKVPILGDLPLLGALFRSTNRNNTRQEVVVMITPQIMDDGDQSNFGYGYVPGKETRQFLQQQENR